MKKNFICWTDDIKQNYYYFLNSENKIELSKLHQISISINSTFAIFDNQLLAWTPKIENLYDGSFDFLQANPSKFENFGAGKVSKIFCNSQICHIITEEGLLFSWGIDKDKTGILGLGENYKQPIPVLNDNFKGKKIMTLSISETHACAIDNRHQLHSWGTGMYGELGLKAITRTSIPIQVDKRNILPMNIKCGKHYTLVINYESSLYYFGTIDDTTNDINNGNGNDNELKSSIEQLTNYGNCNLYNQVSVDEGIKSIPFVSPYRIDNAYCGEHMIALVDLIGNLYLYSEREGLNRIRIEMAVKCVKFINTRIYALSKQSDYIYEFTSIGGDMSPLEDYIENVYSIGRDYHKLNLIDTPYYNKALFFSLECTNVSKNKAEKKEERIFTLVKNQHKLKEDIDPDKGHGHFRYNSSLTANNNGSSQMTNFKLQNQSPHCNAYYHSGNVSPNPSTLTSQSLMNKINTVESNNKYLSCNQTRLSMPDIRIKNHCNANTRIGKISNLLGQLFDRKIDHIMSNANHLFKGKKKIELERIYPGYCSTREGLFMTENLEQYPHKRSMSQSSRDGYDSSSKRKYLRTASQDRYMNSQEVNQILRRAKKDDEYIDSIMNNKEQEYNDRDNQCDENCNENEDNGYLYARIPEREVKEVTPLIIRNKGDKDEESNHKVRLNNKEDSTIKDIKLSTIKKNNVLIKDIVQVNKFDQINPNMKSECIREQCKEMKKKLQEDIKTNNTSKFLTKSNGNNANNHGFLLKNKIEEDKGEENLTKQEKYNLYSIIKTKDYSKQNTHYQCEEIAEKSETDRSQLDKQYNLVQVKSDAPNQRLFLFSQSKRKKSIELKEIVNLYMNHSNAQAKDKPRNYKQIARSKSSTLICHNKIKSKDIKKSLQEQYPIVIYRKPIKSSKHITKPEDEKAKGILISNSKQPTITSGAVSKLNDNVTNDNKTTLLKLIDQSKKEDDSELSEALFSSGELNYLSTKRQSQNELSSNNVNKRTYSDRSSKRGIDNQSQNNNLHIEHIDLNNNITTRNNSNLIQEDINDNNNAKRSILNRNIKGSSSSSSISITPAAQIASKIYQNLLTKNKASDNNQELLPRESNSLLKGIEHNIVESKSSSSFKRSSSMASIGPNNNATKSTKSSLVSDINQRNSKNTFNSFNNDSIKVNKEVYLSTKFYSHNKQSRLQTKDKSSNNDNDNNNNDTGIDILGQDRECLPMNKHNYSTNINTPTKLINIEQVKGGSNRNVNSNRNINVKYNFNSHSVTLNKINKKRINKRPSFASSSSSKPRIIEKVKNGQITQSQLRIIFSKTSKGNTNNNNSSSSPLGYNNNNTLEASPLKTHKSFGNFSPQYSNTMTQQREKKISPQKQSHHNRQHSHEKKIIGKVSIGKKQLREKYIKYLEGIFNNDQNKIINQLLSPSNGSNNDLIKDFFDNEVTNGFINPSDILITYQDYQEDMKDYIIKNLDNFKLVQVKDQIEIKDNQYIPEVTKTNNLITLEYDDKSSNASYYDPLELEKSMRSNIRHSVDKSKIILTTETWLDRPVSTSGLYHFNSTRHSPMKVILDNSLIQEKTIKKFTGHSNK